MLTLAFLMILTAPSDEPIIAKPRPGAIPARCGPTVDKTRGNIMGSMKLGDQPPAAHLLAVYSRDADGCAKPVVLREGIGANPEKALPMARGGAMHPAK